MIPVEISRFLKTLVEPPYVLHGAKAVSNEIHESVKRYMNHAKSSVCVKLDEELITQAETALNPYSWTLEEMMVLFLIQVY